MMGPRWPCPARPGNPIASNDVIAFSLCTVYLSFCKSDCNPLISCCDIDERKPALHRRVKGPVRRANVAVTVQQYNAGRYIHDARRFRRYARRSFHLGACLYNASMRLGRASHLAVNFTAYLPRLEKTKPYAIHFGRGGSQACTPASESDVPAWHL